MGDLRHQVPTPLAQAFVVCRKIYQGKRIDDFLLVEPFNRLAFSVFPVQSRLSAYAHITGGHGSYSLELHLRDADGQTVGGTRWEDPLDHPDPLEPQQIVFNDVDVVFPDAGKYELVLVANGVDVAYQGLWVRSL